MAIFNTNLNFVRRMDPELTHLVSVKYGGDLSMWKRDVILTQLTKAVKSVYLKTEGDQTTEKSSMGLTELKIWGGIQTAIAQADEYKVELSKDQLDFLYNVMSEAVFSPDSAMMVMKIDEAISEARRDGENKSDISKDLQTLKAPKKPSVDKTTPVKKEEVKKSAKKDEKQGTQK